MRRSLLTVSLVAGLLCAPAARAAEDKAATPPAPDAAAPAAPEAKDEGPVKVKVGVYLLNDAAQSEPDTAGATGASDRVSVLATIEKVDPGQYTATVRVWAVRAGEGE